MLKNQFKVSRKFMVFLTYFIPVSLLVAYGADSYRFKGPKYQAPETSRAVVLFREKCRQFKIEDICNEGFNNLVGISLTNHIYYQKMKPGVTTIGLTEFSVFTPRTKITIDRKLLIDEILFDSTVIHELGHAIFNLDHNDDKPAIMNAELNDFYTLKKNYDSLVDEMFKDFSDSVK
jgi:predicted Zn-dependent protease